MNLAVNKLGWLITMFITWGICNGQPNCYVVCDTKELILADVNNCSYQVLCNTSLTMFDIAITPDQNIYATNGKNVFKIEMPGCTEILVTQYPVTDTFTSSGQWITSLVALDNRFLFAASSDGKLYKINLMDGTSAAIGIIGYSSGGDLTWYKNKLFLVAGGNDLVEISLDQNYNSITNVRYIGNMNTTGPIYGAITVGEFNCIEDNQEILVFETYNVHRANPQNADIQMRCDSLFPCYVNGAAFLSEMNQLEFSGDFFLPNVFTPGNDNLNDYFQPIRQKNIRNVKINVFNRWGILIFHEDDLTFKWNGRNTEGKSVPAGVYYYTVEYTDVCGKTETSTGFVTLIR